MYLLPDLPYAYDSLEPYIDAKTMKVHHDGHHRSYVDKLNEALASSPDFGKPVDKLIANLGAIPSKIRTAVRNNGGGHFNHSLFWRLLSPDGRGKPHTEVAQQLDASFGSFDGFKAQFTEAAAGHFSNGWCWLVVGRSGDLAVKTTQDHESPLAEGLYPLLVLDLWEHAYYLKHQNHRPEYIESFWKIVNWKHVEHRWGLFTREGLEHWRDDNDRPPAATAVS